MKNKILFFLLCIVVSSAVSFLLVKNLLLQEDKDILNIDSLQGNNESIAAVPDSKGGYIDLTYAAENSVSKVVYVKVLKRETVRRSLSIFDFFFGFDEYPQQRERINSGSGVIISSDGYIVTNNHVVQGASAIEVTLTDNRMYRANLVGTDPVTDIALLKVEATGLPALIFGDSDKLRLGEWVLAIGSPFNLKSTITAGIVSAKGRNLMDNNGGYKIESFIQTDAAVNPGNSGGALVNAAGELIGINTAIASNTGSYTGYSFAVPSSIVQKVVGDLKEYGTVRRGKLGISMVELTDELAKMSGMRDMLNGVYVAGLQVDGAAYNAGIKEGDIIVKIGDKAVNSPSHVQEIINGYNPNDEIIITIFRKGRFIDINVALKGE